MKRVLVIGDDLDRQAYLAELLESAGCSVESTTRAAATSALLKGSSAPDAIFLHRVQLLQEGREFIHACRERSSWAFVPIAVVSDKDGAADARLLPAQAYLTEPLSLPAFLDAVDYIAQLPPPRVLRVRQPAVASQRK